MPPKPRLHKSTGKTPIKPPQILSGTSNSPSSSTTTISPELEQQFEVELCWCIQQLQNSLNSGKLNQRQIQDTTKILNTLMSNSAPMIKKRQLMRLTFRDYRAKMEEEDKKSSKVMSNIKIAPVSPSKRSVFVKKSLFASTSSNFKFNFPAPESSNAEEDISQNLSQVEIANSIKNGSSSNFHFKLSDNSFRFNFSPENSIST